MLADKATLQRGLWSVVVVGGTKKIGRYVVTSPCGDGFCGRTKKKEKQKQDRQRGNSLRGGGGYSGF